MTDFTYNKDKNTYVFVNQNNNRKYVFNIDDGIFYGVRGNPLANSPASFSPWIKTQYPNNNTNNIIRALYWIYNCDYNVRYCFNIPYNTTANVSMVNKKYFVLLDKLDSIGYSIINSEFNKDILNDIEKYFKVFAKQYKDDNSLTLNDFCRTYGMEQYFKSGISAENREHLTSNEMEVIYSNRNEFDDKYLNYIAGYFARGITYFFGDSESCAMHKIINYLNNCKILEVEPEKDFYRHYISVARTIKMHKAELDNKAIMIAHDKMATLLNGLEDDDLMIVIPQNSKDFENEAKYQHNCVFSMYMQKVIDGKTNVVFIRHKNDPSVPYITCEIRNDGIINQYLTRYNHCVNDEIGIAFRTKLQTHITFTWER